MLFDRHESERNSLVVWDLDKKPICMQCASAYTIGRVTFDRPMVDEYCHATYSSAYVFYSIFLHYQAKNTYCFCLMINELSWSITIFPLCICTRHSNNNIMNHGVITWCQSENTFISVCT